MNPNPALEDLPTNRVSLREFSLVRDRCMGHGAGHLSFLRARSAPLRPASGSLVTQFFTFHLPLGFAVIGSLRCAVISCKR